MVRAASTCLAYKCAKGSEGFCLNMISIDGGGIEDFASATDFVAGGKGMVYSQSP